MRLLLFCCAVSALLLCSCECSKTVDCPGFTDTLLQRWFPYTDNIRLVFTSGTNIRLLTLQNTETSESYQTSTSPYGGGGDCTTNKSFSATEKDTANISLFTLNLNTTQIAFNASGFRNAAMRLDGNVIHLNDLEQDGFKSAVINNIPAQTTFITQLSIGGRIFNNVQQIQIDTAGGKTTGLYELCLAKDIGVAAYRMYPDTLWIRN